MIIVTGGAGFIGSNLVAGLEEMGAQNIVVCDWLEDGDKWKNIAKRELRDIVFPEDLFPYLDKNANKIDIIFHMGAISSTTETDVDLIIRSNVNLSRALWQWCADHNARFIYASSGATYGDGSQGFDDFETPEKLARLKPLNPYGWSKHLFDRRVSRIIYDNKAKHPESKPPQWAGLKFFNVYGPNEYHKGDMMSVICRLYPQIAHGAPAKLFKSYKAEYEHGGQMRDFVYIDDCVSIMLWLYENPQVSGLFNIGSGKARTFSDLIKATFTAANIKPNIKFIEMPDSLRDKYQYFTEANISKLRDAGYNKPLIELEDGIEKYLTSFMACEDKYR
ncbi:MAG: ADP-glyceromanno-heptose 6-epimerase [Alphaproteobacteria bacterium]